MTKPMTKGTYRRRHKYNATGEKIDGHWFASKAEGTRYMQLKAMKEAGDIERLELQPAFPLVINSVRIGTYIADFRYCAWDEASQRMDRVIIEDVKGAITSIYALKRKILRALYPDVNFYEVSSSKIMQWEGLIPDSSDAVKWTRGAK